MNEAARAQIIATDDRWLSAFNEQDVETLTGLYTEDAVLMPPHAAPIIGRAAIRAWFEAFFSECTAKQTMDHDEVDGCETWGYLRGRFVIQVTPRGGGAPRREHGKHIVIWRRHDGLWLAARDIWNSSDPPPA